MIKSLAFICSFFLSVYACAQQKTTVSTDSSASIKQISILPDLNYTFNQILNDSTLKFSETDSIKFSSVKYYWLRIFIYNPSRYTENYNIKVQPNFHNALYYFDENAQKWLKDEAGIGEMPSGKKEWTMLCKLKNEEVNVVYIKSDVNKINRLGAYFKPHLKLQKSNIEYEFEQKIWLGYITGITVLVLFFLNNLYLYVNFRDKTILYFLIGQLGGILYITTYRELFGRFVYSLIFDAGILPNKEFYYYDIDTILMHIGIILIMYGFTQLTRSYLNTKKVFPKLDNMLKYGMYSYTFISFLLIIINVNFSYLEHITVPYDNIFVVLLSLLIIYTSIIGYKHKLPASGSFLLANILPLGFMLATPIFHILVSYSGSDNVWLPNIAIISQAFGFSIAMVTRTKTIQNELMEKELEAQQLSFDIRELELSRQVIELENKQIANDIVHEKKQNALIQQKLETNQRELASTSIYIAQKNQLLAGLKTQIREINTFYPDAKQENIKTIKSILQSNLHLDADWGKFRIHFEQVHPNFFDDLRKKHPSLTKNEIRLYSYFHINLSTKEIANLLNIDPASVRRAKTRLYKKIGGK